MSDPETAFKRLARAVLAKAISDFLLPPDRKERRILIRQAERFLFPTDDRWRGSLKTWVNLAGIEYTWYVNTFLPKLASARERGLTFSATSF